MNAASEIRRGRFSVSDARLLSSENLPVGNNALVEHKAKGSSNASLISATSHSPIISSPLPMIDTLILKQTRSKVGRFTVDECESPQGFKFSLQSSSSANITGDYAIVSRRDLEALLESNNAMLRIQINRLLKGEEERQKKIP